MDLGFCRIVWDRGEVFIFRRTRGEAGFSLLIKEPGLYKLKRSAGLGLNSGGRAALKVWERDSFAGRSGEGGFFAALPLVLRLYRPGDGPVKPARSGFPAFPPGEEISGINALSVSAPCFQDRIIAQDAAGAAALIGVSRLGAVILWRREIRDRGDFFFCETGGIDAE
jgi:hypothetical protein